MKRFIIKFLIILSIIAIFILIRVFSENYNNYKKYHFKYIPLNNVSNSPCFKAKLDHLVNSPNFRNCTFLIAGSSMSLSNISGKIISNRLNETVYNISSWGLKPSQLNQFIKQINTDKIKYLLVAFSNWDFGESVYNIDFKATGDLINGNKLTRFWSSIDKFNIFTFSQDWNYRSKFSNCNNCYESLNFDKYGSIQYEPIGFIIEPSRWNVYKDTTGFNNFYNNINELYAICTKHEIALFLVYLPIRSDLLTPLTLVQNQQIAEILKKRFDKSFLDLQHKNIPSNQYWDGFHMFKEGAESITNLIIDTLILKQ
jgi:hypothetical protein